MMPAHGKLKILFQVQINIKTKAGGAQQKHSFYQVLFGDQDIKVSKGPIIDISEKVLGKDRPFEGHSFDLFLFKQPKKLKQVVGKEKIECAVFKVQGLEFAGNMIRNSFLKMTHKMFIEEGKNSVKLSCADQQTPVRHLIEQMSCPFDLVFRENQAGADQK